MSSAHSGEVHPDGATRSARVGPVHGFSSRVWHGCARTRSVSSQSRNVASTLGTFRWHLKKQKKTEPLLWVGAPPLLGLPLRGAWRANLRSRCVFFFFSLAVFKKAVILVYREKNKLKKKLVSVGSVGADLFIFFPSYRPNRVWSGNV